MSHFPTIDFLNMLDMEVKKEASVDSLPDIDIDIPVATASDFYDAVKRASVETREWSELLKMAEDRLEHNKNSYWYLSELSNIFNYHSRTGSSKEVLKFIQDYIDRCASDVDWKELAKFAKLVNDERSYRVLCQKLGILNNDMRSRKIRRALSDMVRDFNGIVVGKDLAEFESLKTIEEMKSDSYNRLAIVSDRSYMKDLREERKARIVEEEIESSKRLAERLWDIPDETGWVRFYTKDFIEGKIDDMALIGEIKSRVSKGLFSEVEKAAQEEDIISKIEDYGTESYKVLAEDLDYGEDTLVPEDSTGRVLSAEDGMLTVLFDDYGVIATLPEDMFRNKTGKTIYFAHNYKKLGDHEKKSLSMKECPSCLSKLIIFDKRLSTIHCLSCGEVINNISSNILRNIETNISLGKKFSTGLKATKNRIIRVIGKDGIRILDK